MYSYDRRANVKMSPWIWKLFDKIAQVRKSKIDEWVKEAAESVYTGEDLVRDNPNDSDEELAKRAMSSLEINWDDIIKDETPRIAKWVNHVLSQVSGSLALDDDSYADINVDGKTLTVETQATGAMYEYDPNDYLSRTEVPALSDMHNKEIEAKFESTGADVDVRWSLEKHATYDADEVIYKIKLKWAYDSKELSLKYGAATFEHAFKAKLPEFRAEVAANPRSPTPVGPAVKTRRRGR